jgi:hypothetical protein
VLGFDLAVTAVIGAPIPPATGPTRPIALAAGRVVVSRTPLAITRDGRATEGFAQR